MMHLHRTECLLLPVIVLAGCQSSPTSLTAIAAGGTSVPLEQHNESPTPILPKTNQNMLNQLQQEEPAFRAHYSRHYEDTGYSYNQYRPAYQYGYELSAGDRYESTDWSEVKDLIRRQWDESRLGLWTRYRDAVRFGWERGVDTQEG